MAKFFVQVAIIKEVEVDAYDELQAERAAYAKLGREKHNAIGMKVFSGDENCDENALSDDNMKNMDYVRKHFNTLNVEWCEGEAL